MPLPATPGGGSMPADASPRSLRGRRVVTTRQRRGELDRMLARAGADVVHVPLIETTGPADGGVALAAALDRVDAFDWVVVTSPEGAARVAPALAGGGARIATVGRRTAEVIADLSGRRPDVVPDRQTAVDLVAAMPAPGRSNRLLLAQADLADPAHAAAFAALGYEVTTVVAYRTVLRSPSHAERRAALTSDAVTFASGSAARSWHDAIGRATPPIAVAIGPSTAAVADELGIKITHTAADHSIAGLVDEVVRALAPGP